MVLPKNKKNEDELYDNAERIFNSSPNKLTSYICEDKNKNEKNVYLS